MIDATDSDGIRVLRFSGHPANALCSDRLSGIREEVERAEENGFRAVLIAGSQNVFSAGLDLNVLIEADQASLRQMFGELAHTLRSIALCSVTTASAVTGHCLGAGMALAAMTDCRIVASGKYDIGFPEARMGMSLSDRLVAAVARLTGVDNAKRLCEEGRFITPKEAMELGFADEIVPSADVVDRAIAWCDRHSAAPDRQWAKSFATIDEAAIERQVSLITQAREKGLLNKPKRTGTRS